MISLGLPWMVGPRDDCDQSSICRCCGLFLFNMLMIALSVFSSFIPENFKNVRVVYFSNSFNFSFISITSSSLANFEFMVS